MKCSFILLAAVATAAPAPLKEGESESHREHFTERREALPEIPVVVGHTSASLERWDDYKMLLDQPLATEAPSKIAFPMKRVSQVQPTLLAVVGTRKQPVGDLYGPQLHDEIVNALNTICPPASASTSLKCEPGSQTINQSIYFSTKSGGLMKTGSLKLSVENAGWPSQSSDHLRSLLINQVAATFQATSESNQDCEVISNSYSSRRSASRDTKRLCSVSDFVSVQLENGPPEVRLDARLVFHDNVSPGSDELSPQDAFQCLPLADDASIVLKKNLKAFETFFGTTLQTEGRCTSAQATRDLSSDPLGSVDASDPLGRRSRPLSVLDGSDPLGSVGASDPLGRRSDPLGSVEASDPLGMINASDPLGSHSDPLGVVDPDSSTGSDPLADLQ